MFKIFLLVLFFAIPMNAQEIRIISFPSQAGFVKDVRILDESLTTLGANTDKQFLPEMVKQVLEGQTYPVADIQIFIQEFESTLLPFGKKNYLIPNPEWCWESLESLKQIDLILARTREVERIYKDVGVPIYYLGFTGSDQYMEGIKKNFKEYFHLKGFSPFKSASEIVEAWGSDFPHLVIVDHWPHYKKVNPKISILANYLTDDEIKWLQNTAGVHLCPSQTEGFGHYIAEAMSVGSVIITTDAPPMNEFVDDPRFLIPWETTSKHGWGTLYHINSKTLRKNIQAILQIPVKDLKEAGQKNRKRYLAMKEEFMQRLQGLIKSEEE